MLLLKQVFERASNGERAHFIVCCVFPSPLGGEGLGEGACFDMRTKDRKKIEALIGKRKNQILDAAISIFAKEGFDRANTEEIAKLARLGKGTIYRYFKNKEELFLSVVDRGLDELKIAILIEVNKVEDPVRKIENAVRAYLAFFEENDELVRILIHEQSSFGKRITERYFEHYYGNVDRIEKMFEAAVGAGLLKEIDIDIVIGVLTGVLNGLVFMWELEGRKYRLLDRAPLVLKIFFTGVIKDEKRRKEYE